ncbi:response regulator [Kaistia dalseonensis]|uniref:FixJ family two-component response regulator n=1 Tax=Kaistia dalseonensis TaxID=410840 RepID=A0ABU0H8W1_9HYPH|nr:response regulator [Kaistia dalseonensis]MCX5495320.1 response regulator [Kaistia dalseonensis]MDQ0437906.1 FixJ family two-component response regulator [Kaistia dalseonensis]
MDQLLSNETENPVVIIVDDDKAILHSLKFALDTEGLESKVYLNAAALLAEGALPQRGCLVVDYYLPTMDGLQLVNHLRAAGVTLPAILMTVRATNAVKARAAALGVPIVEKPFLENGLLTDIRNAIAGQTPPRSP